MDFDVYFYLIIIFFLFVVIVVLYSFYMKKSKAELDYLDQQIAEYRRQRRNFEDIRHNLRKS